MSDEPEKLESGGVIYRHTKRTEETGLSSTDPKLLEAIDGHIEAHIGKVETVFHEIVSDLVHVDVHFIPPGPDRPCSTLVTSGMSDRAMKVPPGAEDMTHAELMLCLPPDWPLTQESFKDERHYWPVRWLKVLARFPHEFDTWLSVDHTMPNGDPPQPFAPNTKMSGVILGIPTLFGKEFWHLKARAKVVNFFSVVPLYTEEMDFKLRKGAEALWERLDEVPTTELLDPVRQNVCRKRFGFF